MADKKNIDGVCINLSGSGRQSTPPELAACAVELADGTGWAKVPLYRVANDGSDTAVRVTNNEITKGALHNMIAVLQPFEPVE